MSNGTEIMPNSTYILFVFSYGGSMYSRMGWCMGMKKISRISGALLISMLFSSILSGVVLVIMGEVRNHPYLDF